MIDSPGIYLDVPERQYHADPVIEPSLSSSVAKLVITRSPRHAWYEHPRLNKGKRLDEERKPTRPKEIGTVAHKLILGRGRDVDVIHADDYLAKASQRLRADSYAAGNSPILSVDMERAQELADTCRAQLIGTELQGIFDEPGDAEVTGVWRDGFGNWKRMRVDWLPAAARAGGHIRVVDLKTTATTAAPAEWERAAFDVGADIQDAHYREGLFALLPDVRSVEFYFVVLEQEPPYGLTVNQFGGQALAEAREVHEAASRIWAECMRRNSWPGYEPHTVHIDPPKWRSDRAEYRRLAMQARLSAWQRPLELEGKHA